MDRQTEQSPEPSTRPWQFSLRRLFVLQAILAVYLAVLAAGVRAKHFDENPLAGPILFLRTAGSEDHAVGATVCGILAIGIAALVFWPNRYTAIVLALIAAFWLFVGVLFCACAAC
jgi:hypothetical protein